MDINELNPLEEVDKKEEQRIFTELNKIDGLSEYLRTVMSRDLRLHFSCPKDQQDLVRGGYYRTENFMKLMRKYSLVDNK